MDLNKLIIITHARARAAELAVTAKQPDCAYDELDRLRILLTGELIPMPRPTHKPPEQGRD